MDDAKTTKIAKSAKESISFFFALFAVFAIFASPLLAQPATAPATTQSETKISPQAAEVLKHVNDAYAKLNSLKHSGRISGEFDVDGQVMKDGVNFSASFSAPNLFRLQLEGDDQIVSDGNRLVVYRKSRNMFYAADAPKARVPAAELPEPFADLIHSQDPSLGLVISSTPSAELARGYASVEKIDDIKLGDATFTALKLTGSEGMGIATMLFDPSTHLLRRISVDVAPQLLKRGAGQVKKAEVTIDYPANQANPTTQPDQFAWVPPPGARDAADVSGGGEAEQLVGKPAPAFKLKDLNDKDVALADFKGRVLVLDFWASWCGPCVFALPKLDALAKEMKDSGVAFYAVNQGEDKDLVQGFMASKNLSLPVLLDTDFKASEHYMAEGIPQTVVIGKDGIVRKVFIGVGPDSDARLRDAINAALNTAK